jgi:hypothetical protein
MSFERVYAARHLTASAEAGTPTDEQRRRTGEGGLAMVDLRTAPPPEPPPAPPQYRRSPGRFVLLVVLVIVGIAAVVFLLVTAGDDAPPDEFMTSPTTATTPPPPTTLDPEAATKAEIEEAYRQSWDAFVAVASDPDGQIDDPRLAQRMRGTALAAAQLSIRRLRHDGHVLKVTRLELNPRVVELGPETAVVQDCAVDVSALVDQETGEIIEPAGPPEPELNRATYELFRGVWMQNSFKAAQGPCVPPGS